MTIVETRRVTGGVDTHLDVHVAAVVDSNGGVIGVESFPTTTAGFCECTNGCVRSARSIGWVLRAPGRMGPASLAACGRWT